MQSRTKNEQEMSDTKADFSDMLVLGAGQLGMAVLRALAPRVRAGNGLLTVLVAPRMLDAPSEQDAASLAELRRLPAYLPERLVAGRPWQ